MNFLAPAILAGLAAISLPIAIHLLNRLRVKKVRWAAMRFIETAVKRSQRRVKVNDLLLLILRCLVIAGLVFLFAKPTFDRNAAAIAGNEPQSVAVLLDHSASMAQSDGIETRFDAAKREAQKYIESLRDGSAAALILVNDGYTAPVGQPSRDLGLVRRTIELARQSDRSTDFAPALRAAFGTLANSAGQREIRLFTDNQETGWQQSSEIRKLIEANPDIGFEVITTGQQGEDNLAITDIRIDGGLPVVDQPLRVMAQVTNFGTQPVSALRINLSVNGNPPSAEGVIDSLSPGGSRYIPLTTRLHSEGTHILTASIPPDRLAVDNQRTLAVEVTPARSVLIVESQPSNNIYSATGFFLEQALAPLARDARSSHYLQITRKTADQLTPEEIATYNFIFLADPDPLPLPIAQSIATAVRSGSGLVLFPGTQTPPSYWHGAPWADILPAFPQDSVSEQASWADGPYNHPLFALWNNPSAGTLTRINFNRYSPLEVAENASNPTVMLRLRNGEPAFVGGEVGGGQVVVTHGTPTTAWGNLPLHPAFIPLTHRLVAELGSTGATNLNLMPGETFRKTVSINQINKDVYVRLPSAAPDSRPVAVGRTELVDDVPTVRIRDTHATGPYSVFIGQRDTPDFYFAVQPFPEESDLRTAEPDVLLSSEGADAESSSTLSLAANQGWRPTTEQMWWWLIIAVAAFSAMELLLALRTSRAR